MKITVHGELNRLFLVSRKIILQNHASRLLWKSRFTRKKIAISRFTRKKRADHESRKYPLSSSTNDIFNIFDSSVKSNASVNVVSLFYAVKVTCNTNKATRSKTKKLTFSLAAMKFCNSLCFVRHQLSPLKLFFRLRINAFLVGKILLLFH